MAANKFATMLHKNCHRIVVILVYAVLEWILILLLLLNSFFSYLIGKFAKYFGLKPSCTWCSRLDHILDSKKQANFHRDHVCEAHGTEIAKLGYCSNHKRLAESRNLCGDCSSSRPVDNGKMNEISPSIAFFTWVSEGVSENGEENRCSCCDEILSRKLYPPSLLIKPSWDVLDYIHKKASIAEVMDADNDGEQASETTNRSKLLSQADHMNHETEFEEKRRDDDNDDQGGFEKENQLHSDGSQKTEFVEDYCSQPSNFLGDANHGSGCEELGTFEVQEWKSSRTDIAYQSTDDPFWSLGCNEDDESLYITDMLLQNAEDIDSDRFICIELIDTAAIACQKPLTNSSEDIEEEHEDKQVLSDEEANGHSGEADLHSMDVRAANSRYEMLEGSDVDTIERSLRIMDEYCTRDEDIEKCKQLFSDAVFVTPSRKKDNAEAAGVEELDNFPEFEQKDYNMLSVEAKSNITCPEPDDSAQAVGATVLQHCSDAELFVTDSMNIELSEDHESSNQDKQVEEERHSREVTTSEGLHQLHKKLIMFEKVGSGLEDSLDGSVISEMEFDDDSLTTEHLKTTLKAQQKALNALYAELEEERKAAAVAANETMAMITKLQEEKAAMQMEALQYQRMMEEQAEYDQEALQLLNDLMIKREKEKQELEKELDIYRHKILDYEAREKMMMVRSRKGSAGSTTSSTSSGHGKSNDNHSIDLNFEGEYDDSSFHTHQEHNLGDALEDLEETRVECIMDLTLPDISLAEFDEERLCILEELKALEAKLFALHDDETQLSEDVKSVKHLTDSYAKDFHDSYGVCGPEEKGALHTSSDDPDGKDHFEIKTIDLMAKKLLPLFDANDTEFTEEEFDKEEISNHSAGMVNHFFNGTELEKSKLFIQEELSHVYERLQALEADKDFLKHCIRSMMKGNKGLALLQEILQHLRDLRSVELSARKLADIQLADVSLDKEDKS
ncbi:hypothetical protein Pfo_018824 [Paulownia fortunei]|nr:hypothetical protein Pfo_018824 [Paulownia fortunei]